MESEGADWECWVGAYEIWPAERLRAENLTVQGPQFSVEDGPHLVQVGPAKRITPKRSAFDMAVLRLLQAKLSPNITRWARKQSIERHAEDVRLGSAGAEARSVEWHQKIKKEKEKPIKPSDYADIEKAALTISGSLGFLFTSDYGGMTHTDLGYRHYESLGHWIDCADEIQAIFHGRDLRRGLPKNLFKYVFGRLDMILLYKDGGVSLHLRPDRTRSALIYHACQMVTNGTKLQNCEHCNSPFLSGGEAGGGGSKRRDARFCSDECRYGYHNEARSRATRKKKL